MLCPVCQAQMLIKPLSDVLVEKSYGTCLTCRTFLELENGVLTKAPEEEKLKHPYSSYSIGIIRFGQFAVPIHPELMRMMDIPDNYRFDTSFTFEEVIKINNLFTNRRYEILDRVLLGTAMN